MKKLIKILKQNDVDLENAFMEYLDDRIGERAGNDQLQAWESLPDLFKEYHAVSALDSEVFNGRFNQYFAIYASYPPFVSAALRGLDYISPAHAILAREAVSLYVHYYPELQAVMDSFQIKESPKVTQSDLEHRFSSAGDLLKIRIAWLEANREMIREAE